MSLSKKQFCCSLIALFLFLIALNWGVAFATRNSVPRRLMARARRAPDTTVLAIGNSLIEAGFDEAAFDRGMGLSKERGSLNLALGASTPVEQLLLMRYALQLRVKARLLVYGFYDLQLSTPVKLASSDLVGNRAVLYYLEPEYGRAFYYLSPHDRIEFEIMRHLPMMVDRGAFWAKVEHLRRDISQQGMPKERTNRFGRAGDFSSLEAPGESEFIRECDLAVNMDLISPVREIIRQASDGGAKIVFVEMPMHPAHVRLFYESLAWKRYREHLRAVLAPRGVTYVDASHWISQESLFADHLHLGDEGASQFSHRLGEYLHSAVGSQIL